MPLPCLVDSSVILISLLIGNTMLRLSRACKASEIVSEAYRLCFAEVRPVCEKTTVTFPVAQSLECACSLSLVSDSNHVFRFLAPKHEYISAELESKFFFKFDFSIGF